MSCAVALEARHLSFSYRRPVVEDFSLVLEPGTVTGMIGPNGCGKTTVLNLLDGILRPHSGEVLIGGTRPLAGLRRKEIAAPHRDGPAERGRAAVPNRAPVRHAGTFPLPFAAWF